MMLSSFAAVLLMLGTAGATPHQFAHPFVHVDEVPVTLTTLDGRAITVFDTRKSSAFKKGHLAGAVQIDWTDFRAGHFREGRLPANLDVLATDLAQLGVDDVRPVLVCGGAQNGWGEEGRVAWMLRYLGHRDVAILDGGCKAWVTAGRTMSRSRSRIKPGHFHARPTAKLRAQLDAVRRALRTKDSQLLDVRTQAEYDGATPWFSARGGHAKGAHELYWKDLLDPRTGMLLSKEQIRSRAQKAGISLDKPVITYCTGGVRAAFAALALQSAGVDARNYDGSWWEYAAQSDLPVEK